MECGSNVSCGSVVNRPLAKKPRKHQKEASDLFVHIFIYMLHVCLFTSSAHGMWIKRMLWICCESATGEETKKTSEGSR